MEHQKSKRVSIILGILQLFISLSALAGGYGFIADPTGAAQGMPLSFLDGSPFKDFLIPGIILFIFNGIGSGIAGFLTLRRYCYAGEIAFVFGAGLVVWIIVQVQIIPFHWMHTLYFLLGVAELVLGLMLRRVMRAV